MAKNIRIRPAPGTWVIRAGGAVLGETQDALALDEDGYPEVIYFPRGDLAMAFLDQSKKTTTCPYKGQASYYSIVTKSGVIADAAWSYETPPEQCEQIRGHLAFYSGDRVTVEQV